VARRAGMKLAKIATAASRVAARTNISDRRVSHHREARWRLGPAARDMAPPARQPIPSKATVSYRTCGEFLLHWRQAPGVCRLRLSAGRLRKQSPPIETDAARTMASKPKNRKPGHEPSLSRNRNHGVKDLIGSDDVRTDANNGALHGRQEFRTVANWNESGLEQKLRGAGPGTEANKR